MRALVAAVLGLAGCGRVSFEHGTSGDDTDDTDASTPTGDGAGEQQVNCAQRPVTTHYAFTSSQEGWMFKLNTGYVGSSKWAVDGIGEPGSIQIDVTAGSGSTLLGWLYAPMPVGDLSARYSALWLRSATANLQVKHYARNANAEWADGGSVVLAQATWTCVTLDIGNPAFRTTGFDGTIVDELGVQIDGTPPITLWADGPGY